ncbi:hypothetical protein D3C73_1578120 [compost metagenome]
MGRDRAVSTSISAIGRAAPRTGTCTGVRGAAPPGPVSSDTEPHVWHSPHRPTHLDVVQPHSVQRNAGRAVRAEVVVDTRATLAAATHTRP